MEETFIDKLVLKENVTAVRRLVIGGLLALAAFSGIGSVAIAAVSVASVAINATMFHQEKRAHHKKLLAFYQDEIAALMHTSPELLTIDDLKRAAAPVAEGGLGIATLDKELHAMDTLQKFKLGTSTVSSLITTGILMAITANSELFLTRGLGMALGLGLIGFGHTAIAVTVKATSQAIFGSHEIDNTVNQRLIRIAEEIKEKPVNPLEIFGLFVDANPELQSRIRTQYKMFYADLPVIQKKQLVESLEPEFRVIDLTNSINNGEIKPSLAGLIASGDASEALPGFSRFQALFQKPLDTISDDEFQLARNVNLSEHRSRLLAEREMANANKSLN